MRRTFLFGLLAVGLLAGCDNAGNARVEEMREKLAGTWVREAEGGGIALRRVLVLGPDGQFSERARITSPDGQVEEQDFAGEWSYDGTNLKRRYLTVNGRQRAGGKMMYATYQLMSLSASEFVARDNVEGREIHYLRSADVALPRSP